MLSWILRVLGFCLIGPALIERTFSNWFPGLPEGWNWYFLGFGITFYLVGAIISYFERNKVDSDNKTE